jgi:hypothetical protein
MSELTPSTIVCGDMTNPFQTIDATAIGSSWRLSPSSFEAISAQSSDANASDQPAAGSGFRQK